MLDSVGLKLDSSWTRVGPLFAMNSQADPVGLELDSYSQLLSLVFGKSPFRTLL